MAVDEAMLIAYSQGNIPPTLRIYGWRPGAFSLGYFQDPQQVLDLAECNKRNMLFVRRMTGGGVIFHYRELTYSLVCSPEEINVRGSIDDSFRTVCSFLIETYNRLGLSPRFAQQAAVPSCEGKTRHSLCFASKEKNDIVIQGKKIGGNAQRRKREVIFQHGCIPLTSDTDIVSSFLKEKHQDIKDKICCLTEALEREVGFLELQGILKKCFEEVFSVNLRKASLTPEEEELSRALKQKKYCSLEWNLHRVNNFYRVKQKNGSFYEEACLA